MTFVDALKKLMIEIIDDHDQQPTNTVTGVTVHSVTSSKNAGRHGVKHVGPDTTPLIEQRGWQRSGNTWHGHYATKKGTFAGRIEKRGDVFYPYIKRPPKQVIDHPAFQCFHNKGGGWFWIHLHTQPDDGDAGAVIVCMERLLHQALNNHNEG